jgi:predicted RNA binding protein YcfA (HicA-like mRNA interferase family)
MSKFEKLVAGLLQGTSDKNFKFTELIKLLIHLGFDTRIKGSHHIFYKKGIDEIINIQATENNKAKAYQVKQIREIIVKYKLLKKSNE